MHYTTDIILLVGFANLRLCTGLCDGRKWFCIDYVPISKCRPCDPYYLSPTIGNEFLNMINKYVCLSNILKQPCVKGCIETHRTYCNVMYKSIPEGNINVSLKMDISVKLVSGKHPKFLGAIGICEKVRRSPRCIFEVKANAGTNFNSLQLCLNVCPVSGACKTFESSNCESKFNVPLKHEIHGNDIVGLILKVDLHTFKLYLCITTESKIDIKEAICIAQIDFAQFTDIIKRHLQRKDLLFLIHHFDDTYFNFNSNYISMDSIYIYEDTMTNRLKLPKVGKTMNQINSLIQVFSDVGKDLCSYRNKHLCTLPLRCGEGKDTRCSTSPSTYSNNMNSNSMSNVNYITLENRGSKMVQTVVLSSNDRVGTVHILSKNDQIIESITVQDVSNHNNRKILLTFNRNQHQFTLYPSHGSLFSIKIQSTIGASCTYKSFPEIYFSNGHAFVRLGSLASIPTNWAGILIDGFKNNLTVEHTYTKCVDTTSSVIYALAMLLIVMILLATSYFFIHKNGKERFYSMFGNSCCSNSNLTVDINLISNAMNFYRNESNPQSRTTIGTTTIMPSIDSINENFDSNNFDGIPDSYRSSQNISISDEDCRYSNELEQHYDINTIASNIGRRHIFQDNSAYVITSIRNSYYDSS